MDTATAREASAAAAAARPRLRIAGVDPELGWGGGETQVLGLTLALNAMGHSAELVCDRAGALWERASHAGVVCHQLRIRNAVDVRAGLRLRAILRREHFDLVHYHTSRAHSLAPFGRALARAQVVTRRMDYRPNRLFAPYLFGRAVDGVAAISSGVADALVAGGVARGRVTIIPSGVDLDRYRPPTDAQRVAARASFDIPAGAIALGTVGALETRKGHRVLLEALAILARESPSRRIVGLIAGDGPCREQLRARMAELGLSGVVRFLGRVADSLGLLHALDLFVFPSLKEGLGVALLESQACGLPAVGSDTGGIRDAVEHERTGLLVAPGDSTALAEAIRRLLDQPELRARMAVAARVRAEREFAMSIMAARTLELYQRVLVSAAAGS